MVKPFLRTTYNVTDFSRGDTDAQDNTLAPLLYAVDAIYLAAKTIGSMINESTNTDGALQPNGTRFRELASNIRIVGVSGPIILDGVSERQPAFGLFSTTTNGSMRKVISIDTALDGNTVNAVGDSI